MAHNSEWSKILQYQHKYKCLINAHGDGLVHYRYSKSKEPSDYDFLFLYSNNFYNEFDLEELVELAKEISKTNDKSVVIGYGSLIPKEERINDKTYKMIAQKINNGKLEKNEYFVRVNPRADGLIPFLSLMIDIYDLEYEVKIKNRQQSRGKKQE
jgi:hypothetical protein